jgi:uncharacterized protein YjcR
MQGSPSEQLIHFSETMAQQRDEARKLHAQGVPMTDLARKYGITWERVKGWLVDGYTEHRRLRFGRKRRKAEKQKSRLISWGLPIA